MKTTCLSISILLLFLLGNAQTNLPTSSSNPSIRFSDYLAGIESIEVITTEQQETEVDNLMTYMGQIQSGLESYFRELGFNGVGRSSYAARWQEPSLCNIGRVLPIVVPADNKFQSFMITLTFYDCNSNKWYFEDQMYRSKRGESLSSAIYNACIQYYGLKKPAFNKAYRGKLKGERTSWTEGSFKEYLKTPRNASIEGIYEAYGVEEGNPKYKLALAKTDDGYNLIYLSGALNDEDWIMGDVKAKLSRTGSLNTFLTDWSLKDKTIDKSIISLEGAFMNVTFSDKAKSTYIKIYPLAQE